MIGIFISNNSSGSNGYMYVLEEIFLYFRPSNNLLANNYILYFRNKYGCLRTSSKIIGINVTIRTSSLYLIDHCQNKVIINDYA